MKARNIPSTALLATSYLTGNNRTIINCTFQNCKSPHKNLLSHINN